MGSKFLLHWYLADPSISRSAQYPLASLNVNRVHGTDKAHQDTLECGEREQNYVVRGDRARLTM